LSILIQIKTVRLKPYNSSLKRTKDMSLFTTCLDLKAAIDLTLFRSKELKRVTMQCLEVQPISHHAMNNKAHVYRGRRQLSM